MYSKYSNNLLFCQDKNNTLFNKTQYVASKLWFYWIYSGMNLAVRQYFLKLYQLLCICSLSYPKTKNKGKYSVNHVPYVEQRIVLKDLLSG